MQHLVTGATGFFGKRLVKSLLARRGSVMHFLLRPGSEGKLDALYDYRGAGRDRAGDKGTKPQLSAGAVALQQMMRGIHF